MPACNGDYLAVSDIHRMIWAATSLVLFSYASFLTFRVRAQAVTLTGLLESQSLLDKFKRDFEEDLSRGEFRAVAIRALSEFSRHFGATEFKLEIVEPRTGVTVEEFASERPPPGVVPKVKADFLARIGSSIDKPGDVASYFVDTGKASAFGTQIWTTTEVAAGVKTPLGRVAVLHLAFEASRHAFSEDEVSLLCTSLSGLIQTAVDHCKRKNREDLERRLRHAERVQAVGTLAGGIAHEFNNILGAILGYGEIASQLSREGGAVDHYIDEITTTAKRAEYIVNQILTLSRNREHERQPFNVVEAIADALPLTLASLPDLEVNATLEPDPSCVMVGHPVELQQVVMNLCKNASEASRGRARVDIEIKVVTVEQVQALTLGLLSPGRYLHLRVADNGKGIAADILPHIFEPFFTTRGTIGGTGLGLAAVHGLVTASDGRIHVTSALEIGTCFEIYFPQSELAPVPVNQFFDAPRVTRGNGQLIALLEANSSERPMLEEKIAALGYEPMGFSDIRRMQHCLGRMVPDVVMIDVRSLPAGYSLRDIEAMASGAPVILIAQPGQTAGISLMCAPHLKWLRKPLTAKALADAIGDQLLQPAHEKDGAMISCRSAY
jgi:signal transduction histidine kinase